MTGMSRSRFSRRFKELVGVPPHRWVMQVRIRQAQRLLAKGGAVAGRARCRLRRPGAFQPVLPRCHRLVARALDQAARLFKTRSSRSRQRAGPTLVRMPARAPGRSVSMTWGNWGVMRAEERREGKEGVRTGERRWMPDP